MSEFLPLKVIGLFLLLTMYSLNAQSNSSGWGNAVEQAGMSFTAGGDKVEWSVDTSEYNVGVSSLRSAAISHGEETWISTTFNRTGVLTFSWRVESEGCCDHGYFEVYDGSEAEWRRVYQYQNSSGWNVSSYHLSEVGTQVRWRYRKDGSSSNGRDSLWIDGISVTDVPDSSVYSEVLDQPNLSFTVNPPASFNVGDVGFLGGSSLMLINLDDEASVFTDVNGPARISFRRKVPGSSYNIGLMAYYWDSEGVERRYFNEEGLRETDWEKIEIILPDLSARLFWVYYERHSGQLNLNPLLDALVIEPINVENVSTIVTDPLISLNSQSWFSFVESDGTTSITTPVAGIHELDIGVTADSLITFNYLHLPSSNFELRAEIFRDQVSSGAQVLTSSEEWGTMFVAVQEGETLRLTTNQRRNDRNYDFYNKPPLIRNIARSDLDLISVNEAIGGGLNWVTHDGLPWYGMVSPVSTDGYVGVSQWLLSDSNETAIRTAVTGPGTLDLRVLVEEQPGGNNNPDVKIYLQKVGENTSLTGQYADINETANWVNTDIQIPPGEHWVTIWAEGNYYDVPVRVYIESNGMIESDVSSIYEAVDTSNVYFVMPENQAWSVQSEISSDGVDAAIVSVDREAGESRLTGYANGPGLLSFNWKRMQGSSRDYRFEFGERYNGFVFWQSLFEATTDWRRESLFVPPGRHEFGWLMKNNSSWAWSSGILDEVTFQQFPEISLNQAVDNESLSFFTGPDENRWFGQNIESTDLIDSAQSGWIVGTGVSYVMTEVVGPGTLRFNWKTESEYRSSSNRMVLYSGMINGNDPVSWEELDRISGDSDWSPQTILIPEGHYYLAWQVELLSNSSSGNGLAFEGFLDRVEWIK